MLFLASDAPKMPGFLHGLDTLDGMDVATSVATDFAPGSSAVSQNGLVGVGVGTLIG
jgi:hypothetical protein